MKKIVYVLLLIALLVSLVGCGKPNNLFVETYDYGTKALETIEQYLSGDITGSQAKEKLDLYKDVLDSLGDSIKSSDLDTQDKIRDSKNLSMKCVIQLVSFDITKKNISGIISGKDKIQSILNGD